MRLEIDVRGQTVLIIDDYPANLGVVSRCLEEAGFETMVAIDGKSGLDIARDAQPDLILLDVLMPEMDGFETCRFLKEDERTREIPVIFMTALTEIKNEVAGFEAGGVDYITKPFQVEEVLARVKTHMVLLMIQKQLKARNVQLLREIARRRKVEKELRKAQAELEERVEERTAEMTRTNERLKEEISERMRVEERLRQAQKMEAIGTLAGGIAHDFNNILMPIITYTDIALDRIPEGDPLRRDLDRVLHASHRAKELVKQILSFSRQNELEFKPVRISLIIREAMKLLRATLPSTIDIRTNTSPGAALGTVRADATQIHQILMNLCGNAAHAMREKGGGLEVSLAGVDIDPELAHHYPGLEPGPYLKLTVTDTGHGMTEAVRLRIFDPYFTTKDKAEGTGLGLAVVYGIVKSCDGAISVYSEPGKGTSFHILFPEIESEYARDGEAPCPIPKGTGRILYVDDEKEVIDAGKRMLDHLGYQVTIEVDSMEALELFRAQPYQFDLVITDYTMPRMTGADLAKEILHIRPDLPIILCTGFSEMITEEKAAAAGISAFVMKPFDRREMARTIRKLLRHGE